LEIVQLNAEINYVSIGNFRSKGNIVFNRNGQKDFVFTTLLYPFSENKKIKIDFSTTQQKIDIGNWQILKNDREEILLIDTRKKGPKFRINDKNFISHLKTHHGIDSLIIQNFSFAQKQYSMMLKAIGDSAKNPRTINEDGGIKLVPSKDWKSEFFHGCLWLL
jgi:hypothetical protein